MGHKIIIYIIVYSARQSVTTWIFMRATWILPTMGNLIFLGVVKAWWYIYWSLTSNLQIAYELIIKILRQSGADQVIILPKPRERSSGDMWKHSYLVLSSKAKTFAQQLDDELIDWWNNETHGTEETVVHEVFFIENKSNGILLQKDDIWYSLDILVLRRCLWWNWYHQLSSYSLFAGPRNALRSSKIFTLDI